MKKGSCSLCVDWSSVAQRSRQAVKGKIVMAVGNVVQISVVCRTASGSDDDGTVWKPMHLLGRLDMQ